MPLIAIRRDGPRELVVFDANAKDDGTHGLLLSADEPSAIRAVDVIVVIDIMRISLPRNERCELPFELPHTPTQAGDFRLRISIALLAPHFLVAPSVRVFAVPADDIGTV